MFKQKPLTPSAANPMSMSAASTAQAVIEARQESQIWTAYALSPHLRASDLKVSVRGGVAILTGEVSEEMKKDLAKQIALGVDGIKAVDNRIDINVSHLPPQPSMRRAFGDVVDDATVTSAVKSKLAWSRHADFLIVDVSTSGGIVTLQGTANTLEAKEAAGKLVMNTQGVRSMDNQLVVRGNDPNVVTSIGSDIADSWITTKVKSTFMYSNHVSGSEISVSTLGGIVSLSGKVDGDAQRVLAIELAGHVRGVKGVDSTSLFL
jgi:hyperosmotically inducible periplasmic protein